MFTLVKDHTEEGRAPRSVFVSTLQDLMASNDRVVCLEADLGGASGTSKLGETNPERYVQCGISEANMVGVAAGLSSEGFIPFAHTFGPFFARRAFDQIYLSGAYAHNSINLYGSDPGFTVAANGGTHTTWEDVAVMRTIPGSVVCDPADDVEMEWVIREFAKMDEGVHYVRAARKGCHRLYEEGSTFEMGKGNIIREGSDVLLIAAGQLVHDALDAAEELAAEGLSVEVIDMFCIKPLDTELILSEVAGKKAVVTIENHGVVGGLGDAVAAVLAENGISVPFKRHGVCERFGQVGSADFLQKEFKLTAADFKETVRGLLS